MPAAPTNLTYTYTFTKDGGTPVVRTPDAGGVFTLEAGTYTLTVQAYAAEDETSSLAAEGTSTFTVTAGENAGTVEVTLSPIMSEGTGTLKYSFTFPDGATVTTLRLTRVGDPGESMDLTRASSSATSLENQASVGAGYWLLQAALTKTDNDGKTAGAGMMEVVHIYNSLETVAGPYTFAEADFVSRITTVEELKAYLEGLVNNPTNPGNTPITVPLALTFNTGTVQTEQLGWADINTAVKNSEKYVILDLSASTAADSTTANTIVGSSSSSPSGNYFNIIATNQYIKGIILPNTLTSIGNYAFNGCSGLTSVTIPEGVTSIGGFAFAQCSGLTSVSIPGSVTSIGNYAFNGCSGLTSVSIPGSVTSIGYAAFADCSGLTSVTFGAGSSITTAWSNDTFYSNTGSSLWTAYNTANKPGTYTRSGGTWTKQP
jgi:hypothetical protein